MNKLKKEMRHGDTLIEVMISLAIFSAVALLTINIMNNSINTAQTTLEATMARAAVDTQAETLRFIHNSYVAERGDKDTYNQFSGLWEALVKKGVNIDSAMSGLKRNVKDNLDIEDANETCKEALEKDRDISDVAFVLNPRFLVPGSSNIKNENFSYATPDGDVKYSDILDKKFIVSGKNAGGDNYIKEASLYPRLLYGNSSSVLKTDENVYNYTRELLRSEGVWDVMVYNGHGTNSSKQPDHYDFYIHVCWNAPGAKRFSSITTIVRLHNPEQE